MPFRTRSSGKTFLMVDLDDRDERNHCIVVRKMNPAVRKRTTGLSNANLLFGDLYHNNILHHLQDNSPCKHPVLLLHQHLCRV